MTYILIYFHAIVCGTSHFSTDAHSMHLMEECSKWSMWGVLVGKMPWSIRLNGIPRLLLSQDVLDQYHRPSVAGDGGSQGHQLTGDLGWMVVCSLHITSITMILLFPSPSSSSSPLLFPFCSYISLFSLVSILPSCRSIERGETIHCLFPLELFSIYLNIFNWEPEGHY